VPASYDLCALALLKTLLHVQQLATLKKHYKDWDLVVPEELHAFNPMADVPSGDYERLSDGQILGP